MPSSQSVDAGSSVSKQRLTATSPALRAGAGRRVAGASGRRLMVFHEGFIDRIGIVASSQCSGLGRDAQAHQARRLRSRPIRLSAQRLAHEIGPDRYRGPAALLALTERPLLVEADPDAR